MTCPCVISIGDYHTTLSYRIFGFLWFLETIQPKLYEGLILLMEFTSIILWILQNNNKIILVPTSGKISLAGNWPGWSLIGITCLHINEGESISVLTVYYTALKRKLPLQSTIVSAFVAYWSAKNDWKHCVYTSIFNSQLESNQTQFLFVLIKQISIANPGLRGNPWLFGSIA